MGDQRDSYTAPAGRADARDSHTAPTGRADARDSYTAPAGRADAGDSYTAPAGTAIGHVHLKVADVERSLAFYCGILGFELMGRLGSDAAFVSAGGYHHLIGLNSWQSRAGSPPPPGTTGLYHVAIRYPQKKDLALVARRLFDHGIRLSGASDHGVSLALYLNDPDRNGLELYWDRPREEWPHDAEGRIAIMTAPLDLEALLQES